MDRCPLCDGPVETRVEFQETETNGEVSVEFLYCPNTDCEGLEI